MNLEKFIYNLDRLESTNSLKSFSVRFDENLSTLFNIIGKKTERRFPPHCVRNNGTIKRFLVPSRVLQGLALGVNVFLILLRISPFIILCEKNENLNNRRYLKGRMFKGLSIPCCSSQEMLFNSRRRSTNRQRLYNLCNLFIRVFEK